ncbi:hypothetical protein SAMN05443634_104106 [Chishuiella changwenlii]|uniref:Phage protein D n=1 Tax=Chishuiella changwenlii TaxID=1434701 RepID=A0A1M6W0E7_9FLAO|nr:hypothetical protein [Chishuiella changwenlii]GGE89442.1 hypothetical protein GCM10010984_03850 [Chishuiella changwenlii]SHK87055.1 hypothetical protein SAMN05443634_104106 [Chishuiella changwenlii]
MNYLYHNINLKIKIGDRISFYRCQSIQIEKSVETLINTAKITLPREYRNAVNEENTNKSVNIEQKSILDFIKRKDKVEISFGYDGHFSKEFVGYVTKINSDIPLVIECEDEMFNLKHEKRYSGYFKTGNVKEILKAVIPSKYEVVYDADYFIGKWKIEDATPYEVLQELKEKAFMRAWFDNEGKLNVGMTVDFKPRIAHQLNFSQNIRKGSSIKFEQKESKKLLLTIESQQKDGSIIKKTVGEKGETEQTIKRPGLSKSELESFTENMYKSKTSDGFEGSIDTWCYPLVKEGDAVDLFRPYYEDGHQNGRYFVESVSINVSGSNGIKRSLKISYKL